MILEYPKEFSNAKIRVNSGEAGELGLKGIIKKLTKAKRMVAEKAYEIPRLVYDVAK